MLFREKSLGRLPRGRGAQQLAQRLTALVQTGCAGSAGRRHYHKSAESVTVGVAPCARRRGHNGVKAPPRPSRRSPGCQMKGLPGQVSMRLSQLQERRGGDRWGESLTSVNILSPILPGVSGLLLLWDTLSSTKFIFETKQCSYKNVI